MLNLPGGRVDVVGRAFILDGDSLTVTVPFADAAPVDDAAPNTSDPMDAAAP